MRIQTVQRKSRLQACVEDRGVGLSLLSVTASCPRRGLALAGSQERAIVIGATGEIDLHSANGTRITTSVPMPLGDAAPKRTEVQGA